MRPDQIHSGGIYLGADRKTRKVVSILGDARVRQRIVVFRETGRRFKLARVIKEFAEWAVEEITPSSVK